MTLIRLKQIILNNSFPVGTCVDWPSPEYRHNSISMREQVNDDTKGDVRSNNYCFPLLGEILTEVCKIFYLLIKFPIRNQTKEKIWNNVRLWERFTSRYQITHKKITFKKVKVTLVIKTKSQNFNWLNKIHYSIASENNQFKSKHQNNMEPFPCAST